MRQSYHGTPTAVFTEIQLIAQFPVLGSIILILSNQNIVVILASQKSFCYGSQLFEIKILISNVFAYCEVFRWCLQNLSKSWNFFIHQKWINLNMRSRMKTNIMHRISSNNFISYHPYLEHFSQRSSCSVWIRITDNDAWGNKTLQVVSIWH